MGAMMKKTSLLLLFPFIPLEVLACPSYDLSCINDRNSYRYTQEALQQRQQWQQQTQEWMRHNDQMRQRSQQGQQSLYGNRQGSPYRPF